MEMKDYLEYGRRNSRRVEALLRQEGLKELPTAFKDFQKLDRWLKKMIGGMTPLLLSDNYEHFMARLPCKERAAQQIAFFSFVTIS